MSALQNQYWKLYTFFQQYKEQSLRRDIQAWETKNKWYLNFTAWDIKDVASELKCLLFADIRSKYWSGVHISHPRNYVFTVCRNDLFDILRKTKRHQQFKSRYEHEWKIKILNSKNRKKENLLVTLDQYSYEEVRELFRSALDIREMAVVYLVHSGFDYLSIAQTLKISEDYCRKIYNQAKNKLKKAVGLG